MTQRVSMHVSEQGRRHEEGAWCCRTSRPRAERPEHSAGQRGTGILDETRVHPVLGVLGHLNLIL